nr:C39 family peptidase [Collinsella aerofaciens]
MSQSWAVTAAYADYSIDGSDDSNSFHLEGSTSNQVEPISEGQESDAGSVDSEPQDAQQVLSGETNEAAAADSASNDQLTVKNVSVSAHVQNIGWMDPVGSGKVAGTTGRGLNLEALKISLEVDGATSQEQIANAVSVEAHVSNVGWQAAVDNGGTAGTTGQSRAVEALRVRLSGELSARYTVWYRVHSAEFGWLGWACDGADAGSAGYGRAVQAVQVAVLPKGDPAPGDTACPFKSRSDEPASIIVRSHTSNIGWMSPVGGGSVAGTTGRGLPMEALEAQLGWYGHSGSIELRGHVSNVGWQQWSEGHCGTTGKSQRLEAVQIRLTGEAAEKYDVWYCAHVSGIGWLDWACNGAAAGSAGKGKAIEAVKVILVEKGGAAPGSSSNVFIGDLDAVAVSGSAVSGESLGLSSGQKATIGGKGAKPLNSIALSVAGQTDDGSISYAVMDSYSDWGAFSSDGGAAKAVSGAPIKAIKMSLSGQFAANYDIWYRVCDSGNGWTGWTSNGQACGVSGGSSGLCGIDVVLVRKGQPAPGPTSNAFIETSGIGLVSQAHVASAGWLAPVGNGETAGQTGMSRSLQALYVSTQGIDVSVEVSAHVANIGWQPYVSGASYAGTVGKGLAIQAVKLRLTGNDASKYDIYYRVHAADYGWLGWAKNDAAAGTVGLSKQAEAIQIKLVAKGSSEAPVQDHAALIQLPGLSAKANCSGLGWQASVGNGGVAGTVGQNRAMEAMQLSLSDSSMSGGISYSAHVSNIGWQSAVSDGATSGTVGQGQQIQAVKINLTGDVSNYFDVWYRVHVSNYGWLGWASDGARAGTTGIGYRVEALQVRILAKGSAAPGPTDGAYRDRPLHPNSIVLNVPCTMQNPELPTGCESVALTNALNYYGFGLGKTVIADAYMPKSSWDFVTAFWGNPHSASNGNCISAPGLTNTANSFLISSGSSLRAYDVTGTGFYDLYSYLEAGHPVIIWSTIGMQNLGSCYATQAYGGRVYRTYTNSHTVVLRGFNRSLGTVYIADSLAGYVSNSAQRIASLYSQRGAQAVVIK